MPDHPFRTSDFDFTLPEALIAREPNERRDASRLMIIDRASGTIRHDTFAALGDLIPAGDTLVVNTTRVIRARLLGTRDSGAPAEVMLLRPIAGRPSHWEALVHPGGKLKPGRIVHIAPSFDAEILETTPRRSRIVRLVSTESDADVIERFGHVPLPPYIARADVPADAERYQTVYASQVGSVAAPTAGLHFTPEVLAHLTARGVHRADVVLHVGAGTFKPVEVEDPTLHIMHEEWYQIDERAAARINDTHAEGRDVWAVGTTSVRTLESAATADRIVHSGASETSIFIRPGYAFRAVDHLITNFHLPRSTLIMLVAAFAGYELTMEAYAVAIREGYRFYSYGDAMVLL